MAYQLTTLHQRISFGSALGDQDASQEVRMVFAVAVDLSCHLIGVFTMKDAKKLIFGTAVELHRTGIALTCGTPRELPIHPS